MKTFVTVAAASAALTLAAPVAAQTYDAFSSFVGTAPQSSTTNGGFVYGTRLTSQPFAGGVRFTVSTNCTITGSFCLQDNDAGGIPSLPGFYKGGDSAMQYNTVLVPQDRLLVHTSPNTDAQVYVAFIVPTSGTYRVFADFNVQDTNPTGVDIRRSYAIANQSPAAYTSVGSLGSGMLTLSDRQTLTLNAGDGFGYQFANGGSYFNDSVGFNFRLVAVPEPESWALMILGFGAVGFAMRRRTRTAVSYA